MNPLAIFQPKYKRNQDLKERVLKNREAVLDAFSSNIDGAKCCPLLTGQKCIGRMCELFIELKSISSDGKEIKFWRCSMVEQSLLLIELNSNVRETNRLLTELIKKGE
jgi:hypothetical protein